jgi:thioesterase domain-containing protein
VYGFSSGETVAVIDPCPSAERPSPPRQREQPSFFRKPMTDGRIELLGPPERHVNVGGFRLHLSHVESVVSRHRAVKAAIAIPAEGPSGDQRMIIYASVDEAIAGTASAARDSAMRRELRVKLILNCPAYPQPLGIVLAEQLKVDGDGYFDSRELPPLDAHASDDDSCPVPPRDGVESQLVAIWEEILGVHPIGITDDFFDMNGHSLLALRLYARINSIWGKNLPLSTLFEAPTIESLAKVLQPQEAPRASGSLVPIQPAGSSSPLYVVCGAGGNVIRFRSLARLLGPDQPVFALQPPGIDGTRPYLTRLEHIAAHYIENVKARQPRGPYHLAGYSFGGLVTLEMARQLVARGDEVGLVAMLDAPEWSYLKTLAKRMTVRDRVRRFKARAGPVIAGPERSAYVRDGLRRWTTELLYHASQSAGRPLPQQFGMIADMNRFIARLYNPGPYRGRLTLFRTAPGRDDVGDYRLGWGRLAAAVDVYQLPGGHEDITSPPNVRILAEKLRACLDQFECQRDPLRQERPA